MVLWAIVLHNVYKNTLCVENNGGLKILGMNSCLVPMRFLLL